MPLSPMPAARPPRLQLLPAGSQPDPADPPVDPPVDPPIDLCALFPTTLPATPTFTRQYGLARPVLCRSLVTAPRAGAPWTRQLDRWEETPGGLRALDRTIFTADADTFTEAARYRARGGPNLHLSPIRLPRMLRRGDIAAPWPGVEIRCTFAGQIRINGGAPVRAVRLEARDRTGPQERRQDQWIVGGVGELALLTFADKEINKEVDKSVWCWWVAPLAPDEAPGTLPELPEADTGAAPRQEIF